jgi:hypothetical protein
LPYKDKEKQRLWREKNRERLLQEKRAYYKANKEHISALHREYRASHKEARSVYEKVYRTNNRETVSQKRSAKHSQRVVSGINYKLRCNLRSRLVHALKDGQKAGSAVADLGCSIDELKLYLQQLFLPGMTWSNWGNGDGKWNIDHIIPLSYFDLSEVEQFKKACHYTNLQPMWAKDNIKKSNHTL